MAMTNLLHVELMHGCLNLWRSQRFRHPCKIKEQNVSFTFTCFLHLNSFHHCCISSQGRSILSQSSLNRRQHAHRSRYASGVGQGSTSRVSRYSYYPSSETHFTFNCHSLPCSSTPFPTSAHGEVVLLPSLKHKAKVGYQQTLESRAPACRVQ